VEAASRSWREGQTAHVSSACVGAKLLLPRWKSTRGEPIVEATLRASRYRLCSRRSDRYAIIPMGIVAASVGKRKQLEPVIQAARGTDWNSVW
jgi:hypothetical protein